MYLNGQCTIEKIHEPINTGTRCDAPSLVGTEATPFQIRSDGVNFFRHPLEGVVGTRRTEWSNRFMPRPHARTRTSMKCRSAARFVRAYNRRR